jgi:hypothetical protein
MGISINKLRSKGDEGQEYEESVSSILDSRFFSLAAAPLMLQSHGSVLVAGDQEPEAKFRKSANSIPNHYIAVLKDDVANVCSVCGAA